MKNSTRRADPSKLREPEACTRRNTADSGVFTSTVALSIWETENRRDYFSDIWTYNQQVDCTSEFARDFRLFSHIMSNEMDKEISFQIETKEDIVFWACLHYYHRELDLVKGNMLVLTINETKGMMNGSKQKLSCGSKLKLKLQE